METLSYERVHAVLDFWDGIRSGIADLNQQPHYFLSPFDNEKGDYAEYYLLSPIDEETFRLAIENDEIWKRWYVACQTGQTTIETHPALPEDRARYDKIEAILKDRLILNPQSTTMAWAEFHRDYTGITPKHGTNPWAKIWVKWSVKT